MAYYSSYGAAQGVTGSCHLLEVGYLKILVDCGLFQGRDEELNIEEFEFDPSEIDYVIITHAHLDHIGRLPLLVKEGFNKKIISTRATYEIAKLMLANAAGIIQESKNPIYNENDIEPTLRCFGTFLEYNESMQLSDDIKISFKNAGHILGSASLKIEYKEDGMDKSAIFSGDLGQDTRIITSSVQAWDKGNYIFLESTYGDRLHDDLNISINSFKENISKTINNGGVVLLPSFALERTQELLYLLKQMSEEGLLANIPVYLDAPLATNVTKVFKKFPHLMNDEIKKVFEEGNDPFNFKELKVTLLKEESIRINEVAGPKIIIAGSGMCEGGRIKYHLVRYLQDPRNKVIFVGFQVPGTLGRKISDSANETIKIDDTHIKVKADIEVINGFSAHADQGDLIDFVKDLKDIFCIYLIHGDEQRLKIFKEKINDELESKVHIVKKKERIYI